MIKRCVRSSVGCINNVCDALSDQLSRCLTRPGKAPRLMRVVCSAPYHRRSCSKQNCARTQAGCLM